MGTPTLRQQAYVMIHEWIVTGKLPKGTVTSEVQISRSLDMSRTPVRAALQQLELEGYLRIVSKHGILILDSSSQRVSDLLELIASLELFAVNSIWISMQQEDLIAYSNNKKEAFQVLLRSEGNNGAALIQFEYDMLLEILTLCHNTEMLTLFRNVTARLFWALNEKRWHTPYHLETRSHVQELILSLGISADHFRTALFVYIQHLKQTWT
ncbi:hypothetical protein Back11_43880 [Paenibacillus baekrokdamisoli]|uniref:Uncharacterized protein n=1 Tax=Paenibacillus baekrokdamisoli TaxID=1712516 RepID=A0A3G9JDK1_9BACL|nr:GntR family transcriptional regulator [Paenibacillus baekrokdamisoli]MBB3067911.1 DNA-binding GntR family transcriptional regulator [Paenibacillus baekrokdamisoli]BBH23043.1 hypothetical protein Back11_43880 [Paenibacillus baekrokdamisoli]